MPVSDGNQQARFLLRTDNADVLGNSRLTSGRQMVVLTIMRLLEHLFVHLVVVLGAVGILGSVELIIQVGSCALVRIQLGVIGLTVQGGLSWLGRVGVHRGLQVAVHHPCVG